MLDRSKAVLLKTALFNVEKKVKPPPRDKYMCVPLVELTIKSIKTSNEENNSFNPMKGRNPFNPMMKNNPFYPMKENNFFNSMKENNP